MKFSSKTFPKVIEAELLNKVNGGESTADNTSYQFLASYQELGMVIFSDQNLAAFPMPLLIDGLEYQLYLF